MNQAIKLLKKKEQNDFIEFLNNDSFNPYNLFICKKLEILQSYYKSIFYLLFFSIIWTQFIFLILYTEINYF